MFNRSFTRAKSSRRRNIEMYLQLGNFQFPNFRLQLGKFSELQKYSDLRLRNFQYREVPTFGKTKLRLFHQSRNCLPLPLHRNFPCDPSASSVPRNTLARPRHRPQYCACHNPGAVSDTSLPPLFFCAIACNLDVTGKRHGRRGERPIRRRGALKYACRTYIRTLALLQFWQTRYHARRDKSSPEVERERARPDVGREKMAVTRNDNDDDGSAVRNRFDRQNSLACKHIPTTFKRLGTRTKRYDFPRSCDSLTTKGKTVTRRKMFGAPGKRPVVRSTEISERDFWRHTSTRAPTSKSNFVQIRPHECAVWERADCKTRPIFSQHITLSDLYSTFRNENERSWRAEYP